MSALPTLFARHEEQGLPLHEQLVRTLRDAILHGHLPCHGRLPASRVLAADLAVSRSTVELAYGRLEAEGYLQRRVGAGTYVALAAPPSPPAPAARAVMLSQRGQQLLDAAGLHEEPLTQASFGSGQADPLAFPHELWGRLLQQQWRRHGEALRRYGDPAGLPALRQAIAAYLAQSRGVVCHPEQVVILNSSQQGILLTAQLLIDPGQTVWLEEPGYPGARHAMQAAGAHLHPVAVDDEGLNPAGTHPAPRLIYTTPSHQYPLGMTMSLPRRLALLELAQQHDAWIIEDDYDGEYQYDAHPMPSLQGLDRHGRVIYVGTFSKVLYGSLRLAYLVLPAALVAPFARTRSAWDGHSNQLLQAVTAEFMNGGHFASHLRHTRLLYRSRRDLLLAALAQHCPSLAVPHSGGGLQCAALLTDPHHQAHFTALTDAANQAGLGLRPLQHCYLQTPQQSGWLLGFAGLENTRLRQLCRQLGELLQ